MKVHNRREIIAGLGVILVGAAYFADTFRIQATDDPVGPESLPQIVGVALILLGLFICVTGLRGKSRPDAAEALLSATETLTEAAAAREHATPAGSAQATTTSAATAGDEDEYDLPPEPEDPPVVLRMVFVYLALFGAYALLFIPLGFIVATVLFLFTLTTLYNRKSWIRNAIYSVVFSVIVYFVFKEGLGVFLPAGLIG